MSADSVLDTNVLLYAVSNRANETAKRECARALMRTPGWGTSAQVTQEFFVNATRGSAPPLTHEQALAAVNLLLMRPFVATDAALLRGAMTLRERYQISYWDAAVLCAATKLGSKVLYSEDLNHGQIYDGVRVENPFL